MNEAPLEYTEAGDERQQVLNRLALSELAHASLLRQSMEHAALPRPGAVQMPWACIGPRNIGGRLISFIQDPVNPRTLFAGSAHGGLWRSVDDGDSWVALGSQVYTGPVGALAMHPARPELLIVGTGSVRAVHTGGIGLFRVRLTQHDDSAVFERLAVSPPPDQPPAAAQPGAAARYTRIEFDPEDPDRFWAASQTGLWRCVVGAAANAAPAFTLDFPTNPAAAGTALLNGTPTSDNPSWPPYAHDLRVAIDPRSADTHVVGGRTLRRYLVLFVTIEAVGVFRGRYDRASDTIAWDPLQAVPNPALGNPFGRGLLALCRGDPNHIYAVFENRTIPFVANPAAEHNHATFVYHSSDCGNNWVQRGRIPRAMLYGDDPLNPVVAQRFNNGQANYSMVLEVHPSTPSTLVCGEIDLCLSTDQGSTWSPILQWQLYDLGDYAQHADQHVAWFDVHDRRRLWAGNDGGLSLARDFAAPGSAPGYWRKRSHGIVAGQFQDVTSHPLPALSFMTAGGLQDNGSWVGYGSPTWYHIGGADGGPLAIDGRDPRRFLATVQNSFSTVFVTGAPPASLVNPVLAELPAGSRTMRVNSSLAYTGAPFVPPVAQNPSNPGEVLAGWSATGGASIGQLIAPPVGNVLGAATGMALPAPAVDPGVEATAVTYGPPAVAPAQPEGWIGSSDGRLFHTVQVQAGAVWTNVNRPPVPGNVTHGISCVRVHPANAAMVAVSTLPAARMVQINIAAAGAPGAAGTQYRATFLNPSGWGNFGAATAMPAGPFLLPGTSLALTFTKAAYLATDLYLVRPDGTVFVPTGSTGAPADLRVVALAFTPVTVTIGAPGGAPGVAPFSFQAAGLPAVVGVTGPAVDLGATGLVLRFAGGPFVAGHSWTIAADGSVTPGVGAVGTVEVLARLHSRIYLSHDRGVNWADISVPRSRPPAAQAASSGSLPPGPVSSLVFDLNGASIDLYAGTLAGVYRSTGLPAAAPGGPIDTTWNPFNGPAAAALPLTLVNDIETVAGTRRLRVATFGRGIWDCDLAAPVAAPRLLIRQTLIEDGRTLPRALPAALPDDPRLPAGAVWLDHAHACDIRVDTAPFDFFDDRVDGVEFDDQIGVDDLLPLARQAVYVQVHNWGFAEAANVDVHLLCAKAGANGALAQGAANQPAALVPAGVPTADGLYAPPDFNPAAGPWRRVAPPQRIDHLRPWEPQVLRFDWQPPASLVDPPPNDYVALVALCTAAADPLPAAALPAPTAMATWLAQERRAALRLVRMLPLPAPSVFIRDGVDDDARLGNVPFAGRSPDIIVVQAQPADPAVAFRDLLATRPQDKVLLGGGNHIYVRVHNNGLQACDVRVHVWSLGLDALGQPSFSPVSWSPLTPVVAPFLTVNVPAGGQALAQVALNNPADPAPGATLKSVAVVALVESDDGRDTPPPIAQITDVNAFWDFFGTLFQSDNAALRILRATGP